MSIKGLFVEITAWDNS